MTVPIPSGRVNRSSPLFSGSAEAYDRFMGRYTPELARGLADAAGVGPGQRVLDVGCGPGGLTGELVGRVGADHVAALDPAPQFVAACRDRNPGVDVRTGVAECLPWVDGSFDAALSCLVIGFVDDPVLAVREMFRVTRPGGTIAACMWDLAEGGMTMLRTFWSAMGTAVTTNGDAGRAGRSRGEIAAIFRAAGLREITDGSLQSHATYTGFDDFWQPFSGGIGPAGQALAALTPSRRAAVRSACRAALPDGPFTLPARAWYAVARVPASLRRAG